MTPAQEYAERVLAELEEFGEENIFSMLNTIIEPAGFVAEVETFAHALVQLVEAEHITLGIQGFYPREPEDLPKASALELILSINDWYRFDRKRNCWTLNAGDIKNAKVPVIYRSESGLAEAVRILDARGYQWWRPRK